MNFDPVNIFIAGSLCWFYQVFFYISPENANCYKFLTSVTYVLIKIYPWSLPILLEKIHEDNTLYAFEWVEKYFSLLTWVSNYYNYYTHDLSVYQQWLLPSLIYLGRFNCSYNHSYITYCIIILHFCCTVFLLFVLCGVSNNIQIGICVLGYNCTACAF